MPRFSDLSKELQAKVRMMELKANELGKESPEAKELWSELQKEELVCGALNQKDGTFKACLRPPEEGRNRCSFHGGRTLKADERTPAQKLVTMKHLRPEASFIHGLYAEESNFIASLTESEIQFMVWLEEQVRSKYEVEEGLGDVILEGLLHDAVLHFRLINSGTLQRGSKHTVKPLQDLMKTIKEMGWTKKTAGEKRSESTSRALADLMAFAENYKDEDDSTPQIKRIK